jgi:uncharacterized protein involved in exopolysaccharide biosynthesis
MNASPDRDADEVFIGLDEALARIWAGRWLVLASIIACTAAFTAAALLMTPIYRATVVLVSGGEERAGLSGALNSALGSLGGLAALAGVNVGSSDAATEEALAVLRSCHFTESFIADNKLMPLLYPGAWSAATGNWKDPPEKRPTLARACKLFDKKIRSIGQDRKTGLITLQIDWRDPETAAAWANQLVARINAEMRARAIVKTDASLGFLQKELESTAVVETRSAINRLIETQVNQRMLANVTAQYAFRIVDPAMVPDRRDQVRPNKPLLVLSGFFLGFVVGALAAVFLRRRR